MRKILSVLLVLVLAISMLAGCSGKTSINNEAEGYTSFPSKLTAEKIATLDMNDKSMSVADGGIYYRSGDKYGVMSFDGKHDTGAIYSYCIHLRKISLW